MSISMHIKGTPCHIIKSSFLVLNIVFKKILKIIGFCFPNNNYIEPEIHVALYLGKIIDIDWKH